ERVCLMKNYNAWVAIFIVALFPFLTLSAKSTKEKGGKETLNLREVFANLNTPGLESISKTARLDLADYWDADSVHFVRTASGGVANLEEFTKNYVRVKVSNVSTVELKILPYKKGEIVACVFTVGDSIQAKDSEIDFYDASLVPIKKNRFFSAPVLSQFFAIPKGSSTAMEEIREAVPFPTVAYSLSPLTDDLTARLTVEDYISPDDLPLLNRFARKELVAPWTGKYKFNN
ncbi:MAG: DUF3256 family protein, partial [Muribaculaceae bacterium]|nr:DUF3256 family protein [Muribaculaceae bacterium]